MKQLFPSRFRTIHYYRISHDCMAFIYKRTVHQHSRIVHHVHTDTATLRYTRLGTSKVFHRSFKSCAHSQSFGPILTLELHHKRAGE